MRPANALLFLCALPRVRQRVSAAARNPRKYSDWISIKGLFAG